MMLPGPLKIKTEWIILGPMGPEVPLIFQGHPILCVDGGANYSPRMDVWVGDADSYHQEVVSDLMFKHPTEKDKSDLALALEVFQETHHYKLHLWGFLGGRKDHELFNLGECLTFLEKHHQSQILFYNEYGKLAYYMMSAGQWTFTHVGLFSLGTIKTTSLRLYGKCRYQMKKKEVLQPLSSLGLSNQGEGDIHLETDGPVFICFPEEK
jgi:thiamine pyrophosphokinase